MLSNICVNICMYIYIYIYTYIHVYVDMLARGAGACQACGAGSYSDSPGAATCTSCPANTQ